MMQAKPFHLDRRALGGLPLTEHFITRLGLLELLTTAMRNSRYAEAILLLVKNILVDRGALYSIREWSAQFDSSLIHGGKIGDDAIARALDRLFETDRASLMTRIVLLAAKEFGIDLSQIHNDSTSVRLFGSYTRQAPKAVQLKRGHSKDHRPDLKQLVYALCVSADGAIPVHYKVYDGNRTDDTTHWETWQSLRGIFQRSDFVYVADSKLCTHENLMQIDKAQGRFITILPRTRAEAKDFSEQSHCSLIRWQKIYAKRSSRKHQRIDIYELAQGLYQMQEGFRINWFRSSEKTRRDRGERETKIALSVDLLNRLSERKKRGPKTAAALRRAAEKILARFKVADWIQIDIALEEVEKFKALTRGKPTQSTHFKRQVKWVPRLQIQHNEEGVARSRSMDGIFPLVTNTELTPLQVLIKYKYQPKLEKRHSLFKSALQVAPVFLKKNDRIESLMFAFFLAQLLASLIERQLRAGMEKKNIKAIKVLPEDRPSKQPTIEQVLRVFEHRARHVLYSKKGKPIQTFTDPLNPVQKQILDLLRVPAAIYT